MSWPDLAARIVLGLVFAVAVAGKVRTWRGFSDSLGGFGWLPGRLVAPVAVMIMVAEAAIAVLLCLPGHGGFLVAALLLVVFDIGIAVTLHKGQKVPCRCFGSSGQPLGARHLARNFVLLVIALTGFTGGVPVNLVGAVVVAGLSALFAAALIHWDELVFLTGTEKT